MRQRLSKAAQGLRAAGEPGRAAALEGLERPQLLLGNFRQPHTRQVVTRLAAEGAAALTVVAGALVVQVAAALAMLLVLRPMEVLTLVVAGAALVGTPLTVIKQATAAVE